MITYTFKDMRSDLKADFIRYLDFFGKKPDDTLMSKINVFFKSRGFWVILNYRFGRWVNASFNKTIHKPIKCFLKAICFLGRYLSVCFAKTEISLSADIGGGLFVSNKGGIMLGADKMGKLCTVHHQVTFGQDRKRMEPVFGDCVWIGSDTIIYGGIRIGDHTIVRDHTVLSKSIPSNMVVGGNPCRVIEKKIPDGPHPIDEPLIGCIGNSSI